jgi:hypothetical protein
MSNTQSRNSLKTQISRELTYIFSDFLLALLALEDRGSVLEELPEVDLRPGVGKVHQLEKKEQPLDALRLNEGVVDLATRTDVTDAVHK